MQFRRCLCESHFNKIIYKCQTLEVVLVVVVVCYVMSQFLPLTQVCEEYCHIRNVINYGKLSQIYPLHYRMR